MKEELLEIVENKKISKDVFLLKMKGDDLSFCKEGQFASLSIPSFYLRRPISLFDVEGDYVYFLYKVLGQGTKVMTTLNSGTKLKTLLGLGNGFDISQAKKPLLIGGGIGIAPLFYLAKQFKKKGVEVTFLLGFKNKDEVILEEEYAKYGKVIIVTDDGSYKEKGNPVSYLNSHDLDFDYYYACGPQVMLKYLVQSYKQGEVSLKARMGCGFGACMGCSIKTVNGPKRVCKEGPVFKAEEVLL